MKTVYTIDKNSLLSGTRIADMDAMEPGRMVLMLNEVELKPLPEKAGFAIRYDANNNVWEYVEDHRGAVVFDPATGEQITIDAVGPVDEYATAPKPSNYHQWDGNAWHITEENIARQEDETKERLAAENMSFAQAELSRVMDEIKLLTKKVDYGRASEADKDRLIKLDFYSFDLDEFVQGVRHELPVMSD